MGRNYIKYAAILALGAAFAFVATQSRAGFKRTTAVTVFKPPNGQWLAFGTLGGARNGPDDQQFLGCSVVSIAGAAPTGLCQATDIDGDTMSCTTSDPNLIAAMRSLNHFSYLSFRIGRSGSCANVNVAHLSPDVPMEH